MYLKEDLPGSGGANYPWCRSCKAPVIRGQALVHLRFDHDPHGAKDLTGPYHAACSKPFDSIARAMNMLSRFGR